MALNSTLLAALQQTSLRAFAAVRFDLLDGTTLNVIDGSGVVTFSVDGVQTTFVGAETAFGLLGAIGSIEERIANSAPTLSLTFMASNEIAFAAINDPTNQGSPVRVWFGLVNEMTGATIGSPELLWSGRLDTVQSTIQGGSQTCEIETVSAFERLFMPSEGECLNGVWHKAIWPGETGLDWNVASTREIFWGGHNPNQTMQTQAETQQKKSKKKFLGLF
jgi:hypothetical protein